MSTATKQPEPTPQSMRSTDPANHADLPDLSGLAVQQPQYNPDVRADQGTAKQGTPNKPNAWQSGKNPLGRSNGSHDVRHDGRHDDRRDGHRDKYRDERPDARHDRPRDDRPRDSRQYGRPDDRPRDSRQKRSDDRPQRRPDGQRDDRHDGRPDEQPIDRPDEIERKQAPDPLVRLEPNHADMPESVDDFEDMNLSPELFRGVCAYGFKYPSPIQAKTIHLIRSGNDLIAQSQSGTGKTGAFAIGSLANIDPANAFPQVIMIANTRLLAQQILKVVQNISMYMRINIALCIGGGHPSEAREYKKAHVLVGTPGRICEMISKNVFDPKRVKTLIMDESDVLLKDDFRAQIEDIVKGLGSKTQICVFSATFTKETLLLTENFLTNPYRVTIEKEAVSVKNIKQYKIAVGYDRIKLATLKDLFGRLTISQMIIFVRSIRTAEQLRNDLMDDGFDVGMVHGKMNSIEREQVLREFRLSNIRILISTDVMCRGIDIDDLRIVINYDMADDPDTYIHRVGRSGRYGGQGVALNFCTYDDNYKINMLRREYAIDIDDMPDPEIVNEYLTGMTAPTNKVSSANNYK